MEVLQKIYRCALFVAAAVAFVLIVLGILYLVRKYKEKKLYREERKKPGFVTKLLKNNIPGIRLYAGRQFKGDGEPIRPDLIVVNHGGVHLFTVSRRAGEIDNPFRGDWAQKLPERLIPFANPIEALEPAEKAILLLLKKEGIENIPVTRSAVFTANKLKFRHESDNVIRVKKLTARMKELDAERFLSIHEIRKTCAVIEKNSVYAPSRPRNTEVMTAVIDRVEETK